MARPALVATVPFAVAVAAVVAVGVLMVVDVTWMTEEGLLALSAFVVGAAGLIGGLAGVWYRSSRAALKAGLIGCALPVVAMAVVSDLWDIAAGVTLTEWATVYAILLVPVVWMPYLFGYFIGSRPGLSALLLRLFGGRPDRELGLWGLEPPATVPRGGDSPPSSYTERFAGLERTSDEAPKATDQEKPPGRRNAVIIVGVLPAIIAIPIGIASVAASGSILGLVGAAVFYLFLAGFVGLLYGAVIVTERMSFWAPLEAAARPVGRVFGWWFNVSGCLRVAVLIVTGTVGVLGASAMFVIAVVGLP